VLALARRAAQSNASILIQGESGVGKRHHGRLLHEWSGRCDGPFVTMDSSQPEHQLERALFGTPDVDGIVGSNHPGRLAQARSGTLFLTELHATPLAIQGHLVQIVLDRTPDAASDRVSHEPEIRFIAACCRELFGEVSAGTFREDLYWLLNVVPIPVPPLRRRREDIAPLAMHFLHEAAQINGRSVSRIHPEALAALQQYSWPGNVRELQNYVERAVVLADGDEITPDLLPGVVRGQSKSEMGAFRGADLKSLIEEFVHSEVASSNGATGDLYARIVNPVERELIVQIMELCNHVQKKAADQLGMNRNTLHKKLKEYGID
jgi:DNA-binding NtrC family response regulator